MSKHKRRCSRWLAAVVPGIASTPPAVFGCTRLARSLARATFGSSTLFFIDFAPRALYAAQVCPTEGVTILAPWTEACTFCLTNPADASMSMNDQYRFIIKPSSSDRASWRTCT